MAKQRLYQCQACSMFYWGQELMPRADKFPQVLRIKCQTPGCKGRVLAGQQTPAEVSRYHGGIVFAIVLVVLCWFLKWGFISAIETACVTGALVWLLSWKCYQSDDPRKDQIYAANELAHHGDRLRQAGNLQKAKAFYERAAIILGVEVNGRLEAAISSRLGNVENELEGLTHEYFGDNSIPIVDLTPEALETLRPGLRHSASGRLELAVECFTKALQQNSVQVDPRAKVLAQMDLGDVLRELGRVDEALAVLRDAAESVTQSNHPDLECGILLNLGLALRAKGAWAESQHCLKQALDISTQYHNQALRGRILLGLGNLRRDTQEHELAKEAYRQAEETAQQLNDVQLLGAISQSMGNFYFKQRLWEEALSHFEKALEIAQQTGNSRLKGRTLHMLGNSYQRLGLLEKAREALRDSVSLAGTYTDEVGLAGRFNDLAVVEHLLNLIDDARKHYQQAAEIYLRRGIANQEVAGCLENVGAFLMRQGEATTGSEYLMKASSMDNTMIAQAFAIASEEARLAFLRQAEARLCDLVSLAAIGGAFEDDSTMMQRCADVVIRRKGVTLEALAIQRDLVASGTYPELTDVVQELTRVRMDIARLILAGQGIGLDGSLTPEAANLTTRKRQLEQQISEHLPGVALEERLRQTDHQVVALGMPERSVLVEFLRFNFFAFPSLNKEARWSPARYAAFILSAGEPDNLQMIDLGEAEPIDQMIEDFRDCILRDVGLIKPGRNLPTTFVAGTKLRKAVFDPLSDKLDDRKQILLAPDGNLTRLPFEVLPTHDGRRLIDDYQISYLSTGRDVLRFGAASSGLPTEPLVVADPNFDLSGGGDLAQSDTATSRGRQSRDLDCGFRSFGRLRGTRKEGVRITKMLRATMQPAQLWLTNKALEASLKACRSPRILHLATHGFFLADQPRDPNRESRGLGEMGWQVGGGWGQMSGRLTGPGMENPLLRSGLALAGANTFLEHGALPPEAEDGILTAEDVSGLDLLATELVVLSACETGLGEVRTGEGVFGLRRAFVLAGAKTLVMSLWKVPDLATAILMERFYDNLLNRRDSCGQAFGRSEALRDAQFYTRDVTIGQIRDRWLNADMIERLSAGNPRVRRELQELAQEPDDYRLFTHPLYWGAFICQGDPGPLPMRA